MKSKIFGYCRISTGKQSIERQVRNISAEYPEATIIREVYTGTTTSRPEWAKLLDQVRPGDSIVFDSVSRMSRNAEEGYQTYQGLYQKGINLIFIKEPHIDTSVFKQAIENTIPMTGTNVDLILQGVNAYLMELAKEQIRIAFDQAEKEVQDLHKRTSEGIETARRNGKQIGQRTGAKLTTKKSTAAKEIILKRSKDFNGELDDAEVMKLTGISRNSFYKYKKELREMEV